MSSGCKGHVGNHVMLIEASYGLMQCTLGHYDSTPAISVVS